MIARDAVERRRLAVPLGVIPYDQSRINSYTFRRSDCSGLISYVWDLPTNGPGTYLNAYTTATLYGQKLIREIPRAELRPGDAIGFCADGSANGGGGHIALFVEASGDRVRVWDHGSGMGPKDRWVTWNAQSTGWLAPGKCKAWRYVNIEENDTVFCKRGDKGDKVTALQCLLQVAGQRLEVTGVYDDQTAAALKAAVAPWVGGDASGGTYWAGEYAQLQRAVAQRYAGSQDINVDGLAKVVAGKLAVVLAG